MRKVAIATILILIASPAMAHKGPDGYDDCSNSLTSEHPCLRVQAGAAPHLFVWLSTDEETCVPVGDDEECLPHYEGREETEHIASENGLVTVPSVLTIIYGDTNGLHGLQVTSRWGDDSPRPLPPDQSVLA